MINLNDTRASDGVPLERVDDRRERRARLERLERRVVSALVWFTILNCFGLSAVATITVIAGLVAFIRRILAP